MRVALQALEHECEEFAKNGSTVLATAAAHANEEIVQLLLAHGAVPVCTIS